MFANPEHLVLPLSYAGTTRKSQTLLRFWVGKGLFLKEVGKHSSLPHLSHKVVVKITCKNRENAQRDVQQNQRLSFPTDLSIPICPTVSPIASSH